jgi:hypothetical protein
VSGPTNAPLLPPARAARLLEDVIFARVAELIDLPRLYDLEAMLALQLANLGPEHEQAREIAKTMVDRALLRIARTSRKWASWTPPPGPDDVCDICGSPCDSQEQSTDHETPTAR